MSLRKSTFQSNEAHYNHQIYFIQGKIKAVLGGMEQHTNCHVSDVNHNNPVSWCYCNRPKGYYYTRDNNRRHTILDYWVQVLVEFDVNLIGFGHTVAGISQLIPNPTVASIVFWVLQILTSVIAIGIVFLTIYSLIITYVRYMKAKQCDRYTVIVAITVLAFTVFLAGVIKGITPM